MYNTVILHSLDLLLGDQNTTLIKCYTCTFNTMPNSSIETAACRHPFSYSLSQKHYTCNIQSRTCIQTLIHKEKIYKRPRQKLWAKEKYPLGNWIWSKITSALKTLLGMKTVAETLQGPDTAVIPISNTSPWKIHFMFVPVLATFKHGVYCLCPAVNKTTLASTMLSAVQYHIFHYVLGLDGILNPGSFPTGLFGI